TLAPISDSPVSASTTYPETVNLSPLSTVELAHMTPAAKTERQKLKIALMNVRILDRNEKAGKRMPQVSNFPKSMIKFEPGCTLLGLFSNDGECLLSLPG